jgi:hypothetical protein
MLTIKHCVGRSEVIFEALEAEYRQRGPSLGIGEDGNAFEPACVFVNGAPSRYPGTFFISDGTVYVMNDKGRTIGTYHPGIENAVTPTEGLRPVSTDMSREEREIVETVFQDATFMVPMFAEPKVTL